MKTFAIAAAALGLAVTAPAHAAPAEKITIQVDYSDINLSSAKGVQLLEDRIEKAVRTVCRVDHVQTGSRLVSRDARACLAKARASAHQQMAAITSDRQRGG